MNAALLPVKAVWRFVLARRIYLPDVVNRWIDRIAENPTSIVGRLAGRTLWTFDPAAIPDPVRSPVSTPAVYVGAVNYSAQGAQWARALRASGLDAVNMAIAVDGGFSFSADSIVPPAVYEMSREWQDAAFERVSEYTHVLIEAERSLFGRKFERDLRTEVAALQGRGVSVAMIGHGTDVRRPAAHASRSSFSPYRDQDWYFGKEARDAERNIALLGSLGVPVFVSTPDLVDDVPFATWCPVVIDPARWESVQRIAGRGPLRVVHAPTNPRIKGTSLIEPVLESLHLEGVIDYRRITGVSHAEIPAVLARADVVLDQFRLGSYGVAACEAMAAACVTVGHVDDWVRERVRTRTGLSLPIVQATPHTLGQVLRELAADPTHRDEVGAESRAFVRAVHDGRLSADVLRKGWIDVR